MAPTAAPLPTMVPTAAPPPTMAPTAAPPPVATATSSAPAVLAVTILEPAAGAELIAGGAVAVRFAAQGGPFMEADLLVDGHFAGALSITSDGTTYEGTLQWDAASAGSHVLEVWVLDSAKQLATAAVQVSVLGGVAVVTPSTGGSAVDETHRQRIIQAYRDVYGLELAAPAVARKNRPGVSTDPWVSVAWIGDLLYQVNLYPDGNIQTAATALTAAARRPAAGQYDSNVAARPAGVLRILVVLLDYGNLGVTRAELLDALRAAQDQVNAQYAAYASAAGVARPFFTIETTPVYLSPAPNLSKSSYGLMPDTIAALTGFDPAAFDFTAQLDLDAANHARESLKAVGVDTYGWAAPGLGVLQKSVNIWVAIDDKSQLSGEESRLSRTLLSHEVLHLMGYPVSHDWPCSDGTAVDTADQCDGFSMPVLMLGWTDTDGDGLVEILDPTPYGLRKK